MNIDPHALSPRESYKLLVGAVVPRPIAFVTSLNAKGILNAAPYSFFNIVASSPPLIMISAEREKGAMKHTTDNILHTKEFVVNVVTEELVRAMNVHSGEFQSTVEELAAVQLSLTPGVRISTPSIAESPVRCECTLYRHFEIGNDSTDLLIGEVVQFCIKDELFSGGTIDQVQLKPVARMGGTYYAQTGGLFELK